MVQKAKTTKPAAKKKVITKVTTTKVIVADEKGKIEKVIHKPVQVKKKAVTMPKKPVTKKATTKTVAKKQTKVQKVSVKDIPAPVVTPKKTFWKRVWEKICAFFGF